MVNDNNKFVVGWFVLRASSHTHTELLMMHKLNEIGMRGPFVESIPDEHQKCAFKAFARKNLIKRLGLSRS